MRRSLAKDPSGPHLVAVMKVRYFISVYLQRSIRALKLHRKRCHVDELNDALTANRTQVEEALEAAEAELLDLRRREEALESTIRRARIALGLDGADGPQPVERDRAVLHDVIADVLLANGNEPRTARELSEAVNASGRYVKRDGSSVDPGQIHARVHVYDHLFERVGGRIRLRTDHPTNDDPKLARRFDDAMYEVYNEARRRVGYAATRFLVMTRKRGGVQAARQLLAKPGTSEGFRRLAEAGQLKVTMEFQVLKPDFSDLFSDSERDTARRRLLEAGLRLVDLPTA